MTCFYCAYTLEAEVKFLNRSSELKTEPYFCFSWFHSLGFFSPFVLVVCYSHCSEDTDLKKIALTLQSVTHLIAKHNKFEHVKVAAISLVLNCSIDPDLSPRKCIKPLQQTPETGNQQILKTNLKLLVSTET